MCVFINDALVVRAQDYSATAPTSDAATPIWAIERAQRIGLERPWHRGQPETNVCHMKTLDYTCAYFIIVGAFRTSLPDDVF
jgi:hypothetical protein